MRFGEMGYMMIQKKATESEGRLDDNYRQERQSCEETFWMKRKGTRMVLKSK